jgi:hypothetical protein
MKKKLLFLGGLLFLLSCAQEIPQETLPDPLDLDATGESFMAAVRTRAGWEREWQQISAAGTPLPNEAICMTRVPDGLTYSVLPVESGGEITQLVFYPLQNPDGTEGSLSRFAAPEIVDKHAAAEHEAARSFLLSEASDQWVDKGHTLSTALTRAAQQVPSEAHHHEHEQPETRSTSEEFAYHIFYVWIYSSWQWTYNPVTVSGWLERMAWEAHLIVAGFRSTNGHYPQYDVEEWGVRFVEGELGQVYRLRTIYPSLPLFLHCQAADYIFDYELESYLNRELAQYPIFRHTQAVHYECDGGAYYSLSGGGGVSNGGNSTKEKRPTEVEVDCSGGASVIRVETENLLNRIKSTLPGTPPAPGSAQHVNSQAFFDAIKANPAIEHSTGLDMYPDAQLKGILTDYITPVKHQINNNSGAPQVELKYDEYRTVANIHYHPPMTTKPTPSPLDLCTAAGYAGDSRNSIYKMSAIYLSDRSYYVIYVEDAGKAKAFHNVIKPQIDMTTNDFIVGSDMWKLMYRGNNFRQIKNENERQMFKFADLLDQNDSGMRLLKINSDGTTEAYGVRQDAGKTYKTPIKCK